MSAPDPIPPDPQDPHDPALDHEEDVVLDPRIAGALRDLLAPPEDVASRAASLVDRRLQGRSLLGSMTDLAGVGWETVRLLLTNPAPGADRDDNSAPEDGR